MKKKLKSAFILIIISLTGIIAFQKYWTFNAYKANKVKFDNNIDSAMRLAMDDCKKDYFDSMRVVLVKRISPPAMKMIVDTFTKDNVTNYNIWLLSPEVSVPQRFDPKDYRVEHISEPGLSMNVTDKKVVIIQLAPTMSVTESELNLYRKKIDHKATLPEVLVEMAFYEPKLMKHFDFLWMSDFFNRIIPLYSPKVHDDSLVIKTTNRYNDSKHYNYSDSIKLSGYLNKELNNLHIYSGFKLILSLNQIPPSKPNLHYGETNQYTYNYNELLPFKQYGTGKAYFVRATFSNPQYAVLKSMVVTLILSALLILLTIFCFLYITRIILEQKKLADLKDDFINNMTHELKTPIATITVAIEGLQKFNALNDPEKTSRYLQTSKQELNRLNELVSKVLNIAVFENKEISLVKEKVNVDELINDIITSEKAKTAKQVNITYDNRGVETIEADKFHLRNALVNLVDNAIKYNDEPVNMAITCYKNGHNAVFSVKDDGIGIPEEHIGQIFNKFHRVPTGNIHNVKGTGLGLSYVKYIVEAHGGSVNVKSRFNTGSEFIVTLPLIHG